MKKKSDDSDDINLLLFVTYYLLGRAGIELFHHGGPYLIDQSIDLQCKSMDRVLCDRDLRHERVKYRLRMSTASFQCILNILTPDIEKKNPTNLDMFSITPDRQLALIRYQFALVSLYSI